MTELTDLGQLVRERRAALGLTQAAAARRAEVSVDTWRRLESHGRCGDRTLIGAARVLEMSYQLLADLRDGTVKRDQPQPGSRQPMCRRCARPVTGHGVNVRLVDRKQDLLRVRTISPPGTQAYWTVAHHPAYYCSLECMARNAIQSLETFTRELEGDPLDLVNEENLGDRRKG